jgi:hypothetical protein
MTDGGSSVRANPLGPGLPLKPVDEDNARDAKQPSNVYLLCRGDGRNIEAVDIIPMMQPSAKR